MKDRTFYYFVFSVSAAVGISVFSWIAYRTYRAITSTSEILLDDMKIMPIIIEAFRENHLNISIPQSQPSEHESPSELVEITENE